MKGLHLVRSLIELNCLHILFGVRTIKTHVILLSYIRVVNRLFICEHYVLVLCSDSKALKPLFYSSGSFNSFMRTTQALQYSTNC